MKASARIRAIAVIAILTLGGFASDGSAEDGYLQFNGSDTHVVVPDHDDFDFQGSFTLEAWVRVSDLSTNSRNRGLIYKHMSHVTGEGSWGWVLLGPPNPVGEIEFTCWGDDGGTYTASSPAGVVLESPEDCNGWQCLAFCYNASSQTWRHFVDGIEVAEGVEDFHIGLTSRDLWIGWHIAEPYHVFAGGMRDIRISSISRYDDFYDHLSPLDHDADTIAYWPCVEGSGTTLSDLSGNGHDGVIHSGAWGMCNSIATESNSWSQIKSLY